MNDKTGGLDASTSTKSITVNTNRRASILSSTARVEAPFVRVDIGGFVMGVKQNSNTLKNASGVAIANYTKYPNYIQSLEVNKINGTVDEYTINILFPIRENVDPNLIEKVLSNISKTRTISIQYGDSLQPDYIYKTNSAIVTDVTTNINLEQGSITYVIKATSSSFYGLSNCVSKNSVTAKPSKIIKELLQDSSNGLLKIFTGMQNKELSDFIADDDQTVTIPSCTSISLLDYIGTLVSYMAPVGCNISDTKRDVYTLSTFDDAAGEYGGSYFTVKRIASSATILNKLCTYSIDIGYPSANIVTSFGLKDTNNWSMLYNYSISDDKSTTVNNIDDNGTIQSVEWPMLTGTPRTVSAAETSW